MEHYYNVLRGKPQWDSMELMMFLGTSFFIGLSIFVITTAQGNPNFSQGNPPPPIWPFVFTGLICLPTFLYATQRMLGVRAYSVDDAGIVVHHWIGKTSIPFTAVKYARKDNLYCYVPRGAKNSRKSMTFVLHAENCGVEDSGKLFGAYFSVREGECIVLRMKKGGSRIALTPESADEMLDDLKGCVASGGDVVFREGMSDASKSRLRKDQVAEIIGKINDDQIRLIEGVSDDILGRLGVDLDYRNGYVEGLKSLLSTVGVKEGEKEVFELDGFEKKMRL